MNKWQQSLQSNLIDKKISTQTSVLLNEKRINTKSSNRYFIMIGEELSMWYWQLFIFYCPPAISCKYIWQDHRCIGGSRDGSGADGRTSQDDG